MASVVGRQHHGGAEHFVIRQPDTTLALLPAWMTQPDAAGSARGAFFAVCAASA
jgi:hypothetical protein